MSRTSDKRHSTPPYSSGLFEIGESLNEDLSRTSLNVATPNGEQCTLYSVISLYRRTHDKCRRVLLFPTGNGSGGGDMVSLYLEHVPPADKPDLHVCAQFALLLANPNVNENNVLISNRPSTFHKPAYSYHLSDDASRGSSSFRT